MLNDKGSPACQRLAELMLVMLCKALSGRWLCICSSVSGATSAIKGNAGCNPQIYEDHSSRVWASIDIDQGAALQGTAHLRLLPRHRWPLEPVLLSHQLLHLQAHLEIVDAGPHLSAKSCCSCTH